MNEWTYQSSTVIAFTICQLFDYEFLKNGDFALFIQLNQGPSTELGTQ